MNNKKQQRQNLLTKVMVPFGFAFAIAFVLFLEYCPLAEVIKPYLGR